MTPRIAHVVYDVENVGLLGPVWAIAWVALSARGDEIACGVAWADPAEVAREAGMSDAEAAPALAWEGCRLAREALASERPATTPAGVLRALWSAWADVAKPAGASLWCDVAYPVDAPALAAAHRLAVQEGRSSAFDGPFPLGDVAQRLGGDLGLGTQPDGAHHPLVDARWSANRLRCALRLEPSASTCEGGHDNVHVGGPQIQCRRCGLVSTLGTY